MGGIRRQIGREKPHRRYLTGFPIRCTAAEKREIYAKAERACTSASRFLVELVTKGEEHVTVQRSEEELSALEGLIVQLRRLGTNLHELARRACDVDREGQSPSADQICDAAQEVKQLLDQLRTKLT